MVQEQSGTDPGSHAVSLYVYDLSNGLAKSLSRQLTGRQFDAIYHTSIVVHGKEWYFGQGIFCSGTPGRTHFGSPIETIDLGKTSMDRETLDEIMTDLRDRFTPSAYHLLQFNCNTFSNELANILVGRDIPSHITSLPQDFLATPFGQMMGPQIDAMFRGGPSAAANDSFGSSRHQQVPPSAMGILNNVTRSAVGSELGASSSTGSSVQHIASVAQFEELKRRAPSFVVMFTSRTCPPCVQLHPVYESLAREYSDVKSFKQRPIIFGQVESSTQSAHLMTQQNVSATPTFQLFQDGKLVEQLKGASPSTLKDGIESLLWRRHRPHPHSKMPDPSSLLPKTAIEYRNIPNLVSAEQKLNDITAKFAAKSFAEKADLQDARAALSKVLVPWIKATLVLGKTKAMAESDILRWAKGARRCIELLSTKDAFPVIDLVRISLMDRHQADTLSKSENGDLTAVILAKLKTELDVANKATIVTALRLSGNVMASESDSTASRLTKNADLTSLLVYGLLSEDASIRTAAVNTAFNWSRLVGQWRGTFVNVSNDDDTGDQVDREVEILCAVLECIEKEDDLERIHRAAATLTILLYCIPAWAITVKPLLDVVEADKKLEKKVSTLPPVSEGSTKTVEVRKLLQAAQKLCTAAV
jgi:thiol-disulfide isomerase/thioredoxin